MKRVILLAVILLLSVVFAAAAEINVVDLTDDELHDVINRASAELEQRTLAADPKNTVIFDELGTTITVTGYEVKDKAYYKSTLVLYITIVDSMDIGIEGSIDVAAINGWEVDSTGYIEISAWHKKKDELKFDLAGADVESADQLETLEINFTYTISGLYTFTDTKPVTIYF